MSDAMDLLRFFFTSAGFEEVPPTPTYTRADLVRAIIGQQWAVAIACHDALSWLMVGGPYIDDLGVCRRCGDLPCAVDVVEEMEKA